MREDHSTQKSNSESCKSILLVIDNPVSSKKISEILQLTEYAVTEVDNEKAAYEMLQSELPPSLMIIDFSSTGICCGSVIQETHFRSPATCCLGLTGCKDESLLTDYVNSIHVDRTLIFPCNSEVLIPVIENLIRVSEARLRRSDFNPVTLDPNPAQNAEHQRSDESKYVQPVEESETIQDLVALLAFLIEMLHETGGQSKRVAQLSTMLGKSMGLAEQDVRRLEIAALLKDISNIALPAKTDSGDQDQAGELSEEFKSVLTGQIISKISGFEEIAEMVRQFFAANPSESDTTGDSLSTEAQIIAIADYFDKHLYPQGSPVDSCPSSAVSAIEQLGPDQFDSGLVNAFRNRVLPEYADEDSSSVIVKLDDLRPGMVLARDVSNIQGVSLITAGVELTAKQIADLRHNGGISPLFSRFYIRVKSIPVAEGEQAISEVLKQNEPAHTEWKLMQQSAPKSPAARSAQQSLTVPGRSAQEQSFIARNPKPKTSSFTAGATEPASIELQADADPMRGDKLVVVVDDDPGITGAIRRELQSSGYKVRSFFQPAECLRYIKSNPDSVYAVISDYMMPGLLGNRLLALIQEENRSIPCIVITAHATQETIMRLAQSARIVRVLPKPWDKQMLLNTLDGLSSGEPQ